jgi:tetratricopeptide (TPR) repeat protein
MVKYFFVGAVTLFIGFFIGFFVSNNLNRNAGLPPNPAPPPNAPLLNQQTQVASVKEPTGAMMGDVTATLEKAQKEPENFDAQIKAGSMYAQIQRADKALEFFNAAAALKPTEYEKIVLLGNSFFDIREFEKAEPFYLQALEKKPEDSDVRTDLGITFVERKSPDYDRAIKEFQTALALNPKQEATLYNLSVAYFKKGDPANALKYSGQLEQANPNSQLVNRLKQIISTNQ